jgi:hypothetical protein
LWKNRSEIEISLPPFLLLKIDYTDVRQNLEVLPIKKNGDVIITRKRKKPEKFKLWKNVSYARFLERRNN